LLEIFEKKGKMLLSAEEYQGSMSKQYMLVFKISSLHRCLVSPKAEEKKVRTEILVWVLRTLKNMGWFDSHW
jgi:hypothetical protein